MPRKSWCELNFLKFVTARPSRSLPALLFGLQAATASATPLPEVAQRLATPQLKTALMGALLHLDDTQIRPRFGLGDPRYYACAFGCLPEAPGTGQAIPLPLPPIDNRPGEWANFINLLPKDLRTGGQGAGSLLQIQDSNMFMTAAIAYPLYLIDESALPPDEQIASQLRQAAGTNIQSYRRGPAYAFWPQQAGSSSAQPRVGPLNIPMVLGNLQLIGQLFPGDAPQPQPNPQHDEWNKDVFDRQINPTGVDALGNIPNDADDTALALAAMHFGMQYDRQTIPDEEPVLEMLRWRDQARVFEDGRDQWKGKSSGAILTWFKDESLAREQRFRTPESGVIPNAVNNVDCVVNANALLALGLSGHGNDAAVPAISAVLGKAVAHLSWPECGLYYPQKMIFPYALSRAYREGGIADAALKQAVLQILPQIILEQQKLALREPLRLGAFSGGADPSFDLATALGLASLLNIGEANAQEAGVSDEYHDAIRLAVRYLLAQARPVPVQFSTTFNRDFTKPFYPTPLDQARRWDSGVFFGASNWALAQWRSEVYTTAIVLEALSKYAVGYELSSGSLRTGVRLQVLSYARNADSAPQEMQLRAPAN